MPLEAGSSLTPDWHFIGTVSTSRPSTRLVLTSLRLTPALTTPPTGGAKRLPSPRSSLHGTAAERRAASAQWPCGADYTHYTRQKARCTRGGYTRACPTPARSRQASRVGFPPGRGRPAQPHFAPAAALPSLAARPCIVPQPSSVPSLPSRAAPETPPRVSLRCLQSAKRSKAAAEAAEAAEAA